MQPNASQRACTAQMLSLRTVWDPGPIHGQGPTCCSAFNPSVSAAEPLQVSTQGQRWSLDSLHRAPPPPPVHSPEGSCSSLHRGNASLKSDGFAPKGSECSGPLPRKVVTTGPRATSALTLGGPHLQV